MTPLDHIIDTLLDSNAWRVTKYVSPKHVVRATRRRYRGHALRRRFPHEIVLSFASPNYRERQFIKACKRAGEPFPVKKLQVQFPPKSKH